jgi:hypothetical protein
MYSFPFLNMLRSQRRHLTLRGTPWIVAVLVSLAATSSAWAQTAESADVTHPSLWAGASASGYYVQYGERQMAGVAAFVDADSAHHIGLEAEGRWLEFRQTANVHLETYTIGPRFHVDIGGRLQPYVKGLVGVGDFNFPYNYAHGSYFMVAAGGGVDYTLTHRWCIRLADVEYQDWPQFTYGAMSSVGISAGVRYRVF